MRPDPAESATIRQFGFRVALVLVFLRFGLVHELLSYELHVPHTYLLFFTNVTALSLAVMTGGIRRILASPTARWWGGFTLWFVIAVPFSTWKSDSLHMLQSFVLNTLSILIVVAGLTLTLRECYAMMSAVALGGFVNVLTGNLFRSDAPGGRLNIDFGSIGNSNDYAAHLLAVLPFLVFVVWTKPKAIKFVAGGSLVYGLYLTATTGSRGALIAFAVLLLVTLMRTPARVRIGFLVGTPIVLAVLVLALPHSLMVRYSTLWDDNAAATDAGASQSRESREYLFRTSVRFTWENPLLGVGPGQFANTEGREAREQGKHGAWMVSHNSYTQVSSELGIPGLVFFLGAIVSAFRLLNSAYKRSRDVHRLRTASIAAFCLMLSMIGFGVAILFLSLAYTYYLLFLSGLAIALARATEKELAAEIHPTRMTQIPGGPVFRRA